MKKTERQITITTYASEVKPEITTERAEYGPVLVWADAHPVAYDIVMHDKSKVFGKTSSTHMGCERGDGPDCVLARLCTLSHAINAERGIFQWRAQFTMEHYRDKGFTGGLFHQWDGAYNRGCALLDYTPATLDEVVDRFRAHCARDPYYKTLAVKIGSAVVWTPAGRALGTVARKGV